MEVNVADLFARIRRMRDRFEDLSQRIAGAYTQVPVEEGLAEIDSAVREERSREWQDFVSFWI